MNSHIIPTQLGSWWVLYCPHLDSSHLGLLGLLPLPGTLNRCTISPQSLHCTLHRFSATMILVPHSEDALFAKKNCGVDISVLFWKRSLLSNWAWFPSSELSKDIPDDDDIYKLGEVFDHDGGVGEVMMFMMCGAGGDNRRQ